WSVSARSSGARPDPPPELFHVQHASGSRSTAGAPKARADPGESSLLRYGCPELRLSRAVQSSGSSRRHQGRWADLTLLPTSWRIGIGPQARERSAMSELEEPPRSHPPGSGAPPGA
ncbi:unnamed protein product, partial [Urochloa humidicola]